MVFKSIISRDDGTPWPDPRMTSQKWLGVSARDVVIKRLIATQPGVLLHALSEEFADVPMGGDNLPHVISWQGKLYLEDGHHRVVRAMLRGLSVVRARVLIIKGEPLEYV